MIQEIIDDIITELSATSGLAFVESGVDDNVEELLKNPKPLPGVYIVYQGADFTGKRVIGSNQADHSMDFLAVLIAKNLRSRAEGARACYGFIESIRTALIGHVVGNYGYLWPVAEDLIFSSKGLLCYGLQYRLATKQD